MPAMPSPPPPPMPPIAMIHQAARILGIPDPIVAALTWAKSQPPKVAAQTVNRELRVLGKRLHGDVIVMARQLDHAQAVAQRPTSAPCAPVRRLDALALPGRAYRP